MNSDNSQKWVCLLLESPYYHPKLKQRLQIIRRLAENGHDLKLFFYLDGIHQLNSEQAPKNFLNIEEFYRKLHSDYRKIQFFACSRCTGARGYIDFNKSNPDENRYVSNKLLKFVKIVSIRKLGSLIAAGYQILQI